MKRAPVSFVVLAGLAGIALSFGGPPWQKLDAAKAAASASGLPIAVYATVNAKAEGC